MGMRAVWIAFGAATFYIGGAILVPMAVVVLRQRGVEIDDSLARDLTRLGALLAAALGGLVGLRHAQKLEARRDAA
jgi:hypothetical protein